MIIDTLSFLFISLCYMLLASTVAATLFRKPSPERYGSVPLSFRTLFDYMVANYEYENMGNFDTSHSVFLTGHTVISNIFLINFLVAIISTVYFYMIEGGEFLYKTLKF